MSTARDRILHAWVAPAESLHPDLGRPDYSVPAIDRLIWSPLGNPADDNWLVAPEGVQPNVFSLEFWGRHNVVIRGNESTLRGQISLVGNHSTVIFGEWTGPGSAAVVNCFGHGDGCLLFLGRKTTSNQVSFSLLGDKAQIIVGDDCMFASGIGVRTSDDHAMIDMKTGQHLNPAANIHIEPHVWVCPDVGILKGVRIGFGSIVSTKSLVNRDVPSFSLVGGVPARVLRSDVSWDRPVIPHPHTHYHLATRFSELNKR